MDSKSPKTLSSLDWSSPGESWGVESLWGPGDCGLDVLCGQLVPCVFIFSLVRLFRLVWRIAESISLRLEERLHVAAASRFKNVVN